jgi:hypothetical protein
MNVSKEAFGYLSLFVTLIQYTPLIYLTFIGKKKPHAIARVIWALTFGIAYAAQYYGQGGAGAWVNGFSFLLCIIVAIVSLRHSKAYLTRSDLVAFVAALMAIPAWLATDNPLYAAIWVTVIDTIGFVPIFRKAWNKPHEEMVYVSCLAIFKQACSMMAMQTYTLTTMIIPVVAFSVDFIAIFYLLWRRHVVEMQPQS